MNNHLQNKIESLFLKHYREWCLLSYSYLESMDEAEDVVQDVLEKVLWKNNHKSILNLKAYIFISIKNKSLKQLQKAKKHKTITDELILEPSIEDDLIYTEKKVIIQEALNGLPEQSKRVFELCIMDGLKYEVAATTMGITKNTVKYHLKRAFKSLRIILQNQYFLIWLITIFTFFK